MVQLLGMLATAELMGHYGLVVRVLKLPAALLGQAVSQVLYRDLAEAHAKGHSLRPLLKKALLVLSALAIVPFLIIMAWGGPLFAFAFGEQWRDANACAKEQVFGCRWRQRKQVADRAEIDEAADLKFMDPFRTAPRLPLQLHGYDVAVRFVRTIAQGVLAHEQGLTWPLDEDLDVRTWLHPGNRAAIFRDEQQTGDIGRRHPLALDEECAGVLHGAFAAMAP